MIELQSRDSQGRYSGISMFAAVCVSSLSQLSFCLLGPKKLKVYLLPEWSVFCVYRGILQEWTRGLGLILFFKIKNVILMCLLFFLFD